MDGNSQARGSILDSDNCAFYHYHSEKTAWWKSLAEAAEGEITPLGKTRTNRAEYNPRNTVESKFSYLSFNPLIIHLRVRF